MYNIGTDTLFEEIHTEFLSAARVLRLANSKAPRAKYRTVRDWLVIVFAIIAMCVLVAVWGYDVDTPSNSKLVTIVCIVALLLCVVLLFIRSNIARKRSNNKGPLKSDANEMIVTMTVFSEDMLRLYRMVSQGEEPQLIGQIEYSQIKKAYAAENIVDLKVKRKLGYIVRTDSFIKGDPKEFMPFLISKGIKVERIKRVYNMQIYYEE